MRTLVMTGGTRGLGRAVVDWFLARPDWRILVLARGPIPGLAPPDAARVEAIPADLGDLRSVQNACTSVLGRLGSDGITALALNAGLQSVRGDQASADGFEIHFAVNHLANVLIADRLAPRIAPGGRIVLTASEVHDPAAFCLMGISRATWQDPLELADCARAQRHVPGEVDRGESRYSASKLCNVMHARALAVQYPGLATASFNPSVVPATGIARERNGLQRYLWRTLMPALTPLLPGARSVSHSSGDLAWLIAEAPLLPLSGSYFDGRRNRPGSDDSRDPAKIARLMQVSRELIARTLQPERTAMGH